MMQRRGRIALGIVLALVAVVAVAIALFDWNLLRGPIAERVTRATGRNFAIRGDLTVDWSRHPTITARDVVLGNARWSTEPTMASVRAISVRVDPWPLFSRRVVLPVLTVDAPQVHLERNPRGQDNWHDLLPKSDTPSRWRFDVDTIRINEGRLRWLDRPAGSDVSVTVRSQGKDVRDSTLQFSATGQYQRQALQLAGRVGSPQRLQQALADRNRNYPLQFAGTVGTTRVAANGQVRGLQRLEGLDAQFELSGPSLAALYPILGVPLPATPRYAVSGRLRHDAAVWDLSKIAGRIGNSDIAGDFRVDRGRTPQFISANLHSQRLDLADLSGFLGARDNQSGKPKTVPGPRVLPQARFSVEKLNVANADVKLRGRRIQTADLPLDDFNAHLLLQDGVLTLDPLEFGVAGGKLAGKVRLNSRAAPIETRIALQASHMSLRRLVPKLDLGEKASAGLVGGRAQLAMRGDSVAQMAASADGELALLMQGGRTSKLLMRLANLDLAYSAAILLFGDEQIDIRCAVAGFGAKDGRLTANTLLLDTEKQVVNGQGWINLKDETLALQLRAKPKDISLVALRGPILIDGTLGKPQVRPSLAQPAGRAAVAAALATVAPPLALLPLIDLGGAKDAPCAQLLAKPQTKTAPAVTPKPGAKPGTTPTPQPHERQGTWNHR